MSERNLLVHARHAGCAAALRRRRTRVPAVGGLTLPRCDGAEAEVQHLEVL